MKIDGYEFEHICDIEPLKEANGSVRRLMPQGVTTWIGERPKTEFETRSKLALM